VKSKLATSEIMLYQNTWSGRRSVCPSGIRSMSDMCRNCAGAF